MMLFNWLGTIPRRCRQFGRSRGLKQGFQIQKRTLEHADFFSPVMERLEDRTLLAAITSNGTASPDSFVITSSSVALIGGATQSVASADTLAVNGLGADDLVTVSAYSQASSTTIDGGAGTADTLNLSAISSNEYLSLNAAGTSIAVSDVTGGGAAGTLRQTVNNVELFVAGSGSNTLDLSAWTADLRIHVTGVNKVDIEENTGTASVPVWTTMVTVENVQTVKKGAGKNYVLIDNGASLTSLNVAGAANKTNLVNGLTEVAGVGDRLEATGKLDQTLFILDGQAIGDVYDLGGMLRSKLADTINGLAGGATLYQTLISLNQIAGVSATGVTTASGDVTLDITLDVQTTLSVDLSLGADIEKLVNVDSLRGDLATRVQWSLRAAETAAGAFTATSLSNLLFGADLNQTSFVGNSGFLGLNFASPTALTLNADVTVNTNSINGTATSALLSLDVTTLTQTGTANASVNLDGTTTVSGVTVTLPSGLHALASLNSGATFDLFASPTLTASDNFTAAGIKTFSLVSASEMLAHFSGFADFLGVFDSKALSFAIPLSASGTTFGDMLNLKREFSENFLSLVQTQSLTTSTLVSSLNNGGGLRFVAGDDFKVTLSNGTMFNVDLTSSDTTLGQVISKIQTASGSAANGTFEARIDPRSGALALSDRTGGGGTLKVEALNQSFAARDLDLLAEGTRQLDENTLARDLNSGTGVRTVAGNDLRITIGPTTFDVDLNSSTAQSSLDANTTLANLIRKIKDSAPISVAPNKWEVSFDTTNYRLVILDKTGNSPINASVSALNSSLALTDLKINASAGPYLTAPLIVAQSIGFKGPSFRSIQQFVSLADAGANVTVSGFDYATSGTPTLKFTAAVTLGGSGDALTEAAALFSTGALNGVATTGGSVTLTPSGTLTLPFEIELAALHNGFNLGSGTTSSFKVSDLNRGRGVETIAGKDDIQINLSNGTNFVVNLDHDPSTTFLSTLGFTTVAGDDVTVTLKDGTSFGADLGTIGTKTLADLVAALNAAYDVANPTGTGFSAKINAARGSLILIDSSTGGATFAVTSPGGLSLGSPATEVLDGELTLFAEASLVTLGHLMQKIQTAATTASLTTAQFEVRINESHTGLLLIDGTNGSSDFEVVALNDSFARIALGLTPTGDAPVVTNSTLISSLTRTAGFGTTSGNDIKITLQDGSTFDVDLDGAGTTVSDLIARIQSTANTALGVNQTKFKTGLPTGSDNPSLLDYTTGGGTFAVTNLSGSTAATVLGLTDASNLGQDSASTNLRYIGVSSQTRLIDGSPLDGDVPTAHAGFRGATLSSSVAVSTTNLAATGLWGPVDVAISGGSASGSAVFNMSFADAGTDAADGFASLRELLEGLADVTKIINGTPTGAFAITAPVTITSAFGGLSATAPLSINIANAFDSGTAPTLSFTGSNTTIDFLNDVQTLTIPQVLTLLDQTGDYLVGLQDSDPELSKPLTGLNRSLGQLLPFGERFKVIAAALNLNPPRSLQVLKSTLIALGFTNVELTHDGTSGTEALQLDLTYSPSQTSLQRFHLDLAALTGVDLAALGLDTIGAIIDLNNTRLVNVTTVGTLNLKLGVDLASSHAGFVRNATTMNFNVSAQQTDLSFQALFGARSVEIIGGTYRLDSDGAGASTTPASYAVTLSGGSNNRQTFAQAPAGTSTIFSGRADATIPIHYPTDLEQSLITTVTVGVGSTTTLTATGPSVRTTLLSRGLNGNIQGLRSGFQELFRLLDFAFDAAIFSRELPFVGTQLMQAADLFTQIRDKVGDNFDFVHGILTPDKAKQAIFDAFGPGGLNWLQDKNGDTFVNLEDIVVVNMPNDVLFDMNLAVASRLLPIPTDIDLILPGLGLKIDGQSQVRLGFTMPLKFGISVADGVYLDQSTINGLAIKLDVALPTPDPAVGHLKGTLGTLPYQITQIGANTGLHGDFAFRLNDTDANGKLKLSELIGSLGAAARPTVPQVQTAARGIILGGFTSTNAAHTANDSLTINLQLKTDLPPGTALPTYRTDLTIGNWSFTSVINSTTTSHTEIKPTISFDHTQFELVSFVKDFMGAALTRLETAMDPMDAIVYLLTNEAFPIISLVLGRSPYTSANSFGGGVQVGDYAGAAEAISRIVLGENNSGSNIDAFIRGGGFGSGSKAWLVGAPGNLLDTWAPVPWELLYRADFGWSSQSFGGMPERLQYVKALSTLAGTAWIDIGNTTLTDFMIDGTAARTSPVNLQPINVNAKPFGAPSTSESINADTIFAQVRRLAGNAATDEHIHDAALDFIATQMLAGRGKFEGFFGGGVNVLINVFGGGGGFNPIELPILNDPTNHNAAQSFHLLFGDAKLGNPANVLKDTNLLKFHTPELFLYLYQQIPIPPKKAAEKVLDDSGGTIYKAVTAFGVDFVPYVVVAFEARADFEVAFDTTGLDRYNHTRNPADLVNGFYFNDAEGLAKNGPGSIKAVGSNSDPDEAKIVGGIGLGVKIVFNVSIIKLEIGVEAIVFFGQVWNLHDTDNSDLENRIRAQEFDLNTDNSVYDRSFVIEVRADVYVKLSIGISIFRLTIIDIRFNLFTIEFDIPYIGQDFDDLTNLYTTVAGGVLTLDLSGGGTNKVFYIGAGDRAGEVWLSAFGNSQFFRDVTSIVGTSGAGADQFFVSPALTVPVTIHAGEGDDKLIVLSRRTRDTAVGAPVYFYGEGGNDTLTGGRVGSLLDGGTANDLIEGGAGNDTINGGDGLNLIRGFAGDDSITGGNDMDSIDGGVGADTIDGSVGADTIDGNADNDLILGGEGADMLSGGDGRDTIRGGAGDDVIFGELGSDYVYGDEGADTLFGAQNDDYLSGGAGNDRLDGEGASDEIYGDNGLTGAQVPDEGKVPFNKDVIISGEGNDTLNGQQDSDTYLITYHGGKSSSVITVLDTGSEVGTDIFQVTGTVNSDKILLRASTDGGSAFVALLNDDLNAEVIHYIGVERIAINGSFGNDTFVSDDTSAEVVLNGDDGDDTFQIGQIFRSQRTHDFANVAIADEFATIETTRGFLSNGVSAPMTINGGAGSDTFTVYHNLAVLTLNGDEGNDNFQIKAFALVGSEDSKRARTDISGGAGGDLIQYAVNAPVNIDGGDGFDSLIAIGTEFGDDFVITENGVFGAGLNVHFANIESLKIDGAEGDDRFFVQSTSPTFATEILGGLGNDTFNMSGATPPVDSNDLLGHSGIVTHGVESVDPRYDAQKLYGISANVADNDEPGVVIRQSDGATIIAEGGQTDQYTVVLTHQPTTDILVKALAPLMTEKQRELRTRAFSVSSPAPGAINSADGTSVALRFTRDNWFIPQTVTVGATSQVFTDAAGLLTRPELGDSPTFAYDDNSDEGVRFGVINHIVVADVRSVSGQMTAATNVTSVSKATQVLLEITSTPTGTYTLTIDSIPVTASAGGDVSATLDAIKTAVNNAQQAASSSSPLQDVTARRMIQSTITVSGPITPGKQYQIKLGEQLVTYTVPDSGVSSVAQVASGLALAINAANLTRVTADDRADNGTLVVLAPSTTTITDPLNVTASTPIQLLQLSAEDGNLLTDDSTNFSVTGAGARFNVDGSAGATTTLVQDTTNLNDSLIGRKLTITGGPGAGQQRFVTGISGGSIVTVDRPWNIDDSPTKESSYLIRIDDALVGRPSTSSTGTTFTDTARTTLFPTAGEGLRGRILQVVGGPGGGQQRLILSNTATTLTLNGNITVSTASVYRIELFDGLAVPGVSVQINDNDQAGIIVTESGDGTAVIEGGDGNQTGERDTLTIQLTKTPSGTVTVALSNPDGQLSPSASSLSFSSTAPQTVTLSAAQDIVREGEHTGLLNFGLSGGNADLAVPTTVNFAPVRPTFYVGLPQTPDATPAVTVTVNLVARDPSRFAVVGNKIVFLQAVPDALAEGKFEAVTGSIAVSYTYTIDGFAAAVTNPVLVRINDDDAPTVLVRETGGSTDVVEGGAQIVTLNVTGGTFVTDSLVGRTITLTSGTGAIQSAKGGVTPTTSATVISNTNNTVTVFHQWTVLPDSTTTFTISTPPSPASISVPGSRSGEISVAAERDTYLVTLKAGNTYTFDMDGSDSGQGTLRDTFLRLFDSNLTQVASDDDSGPGLSSHLVYTPTADGTFTLNAGSYIDATTGTYRLNTSVAGEIPASTATGASLVLPGSANGNVDSSGDQDWFRISMEVGFTYTFDLNGNSLTDPMLRLIGTNGSTELAFNDDYFGLQSRIIYTPTVTGTYYLAATGYSTRTGTYMLSGTISPTPFQIATITTQNMSSDTYDVVLTAEPTHPVIVIVTPEMTVTTRTGGIRHEAVQVTVSSSDSRVTNNGDGTLTVTFSAGDWDRPVVVTTTAIDDNFVDGGDKQVFAPHPNTLSRILGPLTVNGGGDEGSLNVNSALVLPGETNINASTGNVVGFVDATHMTVTTANLQTYLGSGVLLATLVGKTLTVTQAINNTALDQFRLILAQAAGTVAGTTVLTLNDSFDLGAGLRSDITKYAITTQSVNFFADEEQSIDTIFVHDEDSPADSSGVLTANTITGFHMGPDNVDGVVLHGQFKTYGITFNQLEVVDLNLGRGFNNLKVLGTPTRSDGYQAWTFAHTGDDQPDPNQPNITGDNVTIRLNAVESITQDDAVLHPLFSSASNLVDGRSQITFTGSPFAGLDLRGQVFRADNDEELRIVSHTNNVLTLLGNWDSLPTGAMTLQVVKLADGRFALDAGGGNDVVDASGSTLPLFLFGGAGNDSITGGLGNDVIFGDMGRVDFFGDADTNGNRPIVTRLGFAPDPITALATGPFTNQSTLNDSAANFPVPDGNDIGLVGLYVSINNGTGFTQEPRLITGNTTTSLTVSPNWSIPLDATSRYRISTTPENQTDGRVHTDFLAISVSATIGGNDTISSGLGRDVIFGGSGADNIATSASMADAVILGDNGSANYIGGVLTHIQTSDAAHGGNDTITSTAGREVIFGGSGADTINVSASSADVVILGDNGSADFTGSVLTHVQTNSVAFGGNDTITSIAGQNVIFGGSGGDTINATGSTSKAVIVGDHGTANFSGGLLTNIATSDTTSGGNDDITGGTSLDFLIGGFGNDTIRGAGDTDRIVGDNAVMTFVSGLFFSLTQSNPAGTFGNDSLFGGLADDTINGGSGNDTLTGDEGNDRLLGELGDDFYVFAACNIAEIDTVIELTGEGTDWLDFSALPDTINVLVDLTKDNALGTHLNRTVITGAAGQAVNVENAIGGAGQDTFLGSVANNRFEGRNGQDTFTGAAGSDTIVGGQGDDIYLFFNASVLETDVVIEMANEGIDLLDFRGLTPPAGVVVNLTSDIATATHRNRKLITGGAGQAANLENVFTTVGHDIITGNGANNRIETGNGNDKIYAGSGNDTVLAGTGNDTIDGGTGIDWIIDSTLSDFVLATNLIVGNGTDPLASIEHAELFGNSLKNKLDASRFTPGYVILHAGDGDDTLLGGAGSDLLEGGNGIDLVIQTSRFDQVLTPTLLTGNGSDTLSSIERANLIASNSLGNLIDASGFNGPVTLTGGTGPDRIRSSPVGGLISGGSGKDTIIGGAAADNINGGNDDDSISSGDGFDTISGGVGNDWLDGGIGADLITGGDGRDKIFGDTGSDTIDGGTGDDTISGGAGADSITGGSGNDIISGGDGSDFLDGQSGNDVLLGDDGSDTLRGGAGRDVCLGGDDNDNVDGGAERDTIAGGSGNDVLSTLAEIDEAFTFDFSKLLV